MAEFIHGNQSIHYELAGVREFRLRTPVLLLHGNGEDMHIFDNMIAPLLDAFFSTLYFVFNLLLLCLLYLFFLPVKL